MTRQTQLELRVPGLTNAIGIQSSTADLIACIGQTEALRRILRTGRMVQAQAVSNDVSLLYVERHG